MSTRRKWLRRIVGVALVAATCTAYLIYSHTALDRQIAAEESRLTALGVRIEPQRPSGGGRFLRYAAALAELHRLPSWNYKPGTKRAYLKLRETALCEIRRLTKDEGAPIVGSWETVRFGGAMTSLVQMAALKRMDGKRAEALEWLRAAFRLALDYSADETRPVTYVTRIDRDLAWEAGAFLKVFGRDPDCVELVREILALTVVKPSELVSNAWAFLSEEEAAFAKGSILWDDPCTPAGREGEIALQLYKVGTIRKGVKLRSLTRLRRQAESLSRAGKTYAQLLREEQQINEDFTKGLPTDACAYAARYLFAYPNEYSGYFCGLQARSMILEAALTLVEARGSGELPTKLPSDQRFIDPYTGAPFVYRVTKGGFRLYSVGRNGVDDGGYARSSDDLELGTCWSTRDL